MTDREAFDEALHQELPGVPLSDTEINLAWWAWRAGKIQAPAVQAELRDAERLDWLLRKLPGDALRHCVGVLSDTSDEDEFREAIDAAIEAEKGGAK